MPRAWLGLFRGVAEIHCRGPPSTRCKHPLILRFSGDFWFHFISTWYVSGATMLWSKRPHLGTRSFSNIHVQQHRILKKLPCDGKNSDFICASQHNCYLILHTRLPYIVAYAYNRDFWNLQPDEIGQNENFTKFVQIDKAVIQYIRSILQRVFFAPVIIPWNATHSKITTKCYDRITYQGGGSAMFLSSSE